MLITVRQDALRVVVFSFARVCSAVNDLQRALYHQRHGFYFRYVKEWLLCLCVSVGLSSL